MATRRHYRDSLRREARWRLLANASPQKENALALEKKQHEAETLTLVLGGIQSDIRALLEEDMIGPRVRKQLTHMLNRWKL